MYYSGGCAALRRLRKRLPISAWSGENATGGADGFLWRGCATTPARSAGQQGLGKALPNKYLSGVEDEAGAESGTMDDTCSFSFLKPNTLFFMTMKPVAVTAFPNYGKNKTWQICSLSDSPRLIFLYAVIISYFYYNTVIQFV